MYTTLEQYLELYPFIPSTPYYIIKNIIEESNRFINFDDIEFIYGKNLNKHSSNIEFYLIDKNMNIIILNRDKASKNVESTIYLFKNLINITTSTKSSNLHFELCLFYPNNHTISFNPASDTEVECRIELEETLAEISKAFFGKISS